MKDLWCAVKKPDGNNNKSDNRNIKTSNKKEQCDTDKTYSASVGDQLNQCFISTQHVLISKILNIIVNVSFIHKIYIYKEQSNKCLCVFEDYSRAETK